MQISDVKDQRARRKIVKIKVYRCVCGEDVYEDDDQCINCRRPVEPGKLEEVEVAKVISEKIDDDVKNERFE
jgi:hypothetical protein